MEARSLACPWCHYVNNFDDPDQRYCTQCGHRADVARVDCDCFKCRGAHEQAAEVRRIDEAALARILRGRRRIAV